MKKRSELLVATVLCVGIATGVAASGLIREIRAELRPDFVVKIDGEKRDFKNAKGEVVYPILHDGTTYLPVRAIGELMGKKVFWYEDEKRVELKDVTVTDADVIVSGKEKADNKTDNKESFISIGEAKNIALNKAGYDESEVKFERTELDEDEGIWHYEVEFITGGVEYDFDIGAVNGAILSYEVDHYDDDEPIKENNSLVEDFITKEKAKEIALKKAEVKAENVVFDRVELDKDDGRYHYEIEFRVKAVEYEIGIDAKTGDIISFERDNED